MDTKNLIERLKLVYQVKENKALGSAMGISASTVANWKTGDCKPNLEFIFSAVEPIDVNLHWLLTGNGEMYTNSKCCNGNIEEKYYAEIGRAFKRQMDLIAKLERISSGTIRVHNGFASLAGAQHDLDSEELCAAVK